jgi:hypothetical protein
MKEWLPRSALVVFGATLAVTGIGFSRAPVFNHLVATDAGSPGDWRLANVPDWQLVGIAALLVTVVATCAWIVAARLVFRRGPRSAGPYLLAGGLASIALAVAALFPSLVSVGCDGSVPRWALPDDYDGGGCIPMPENMAATQPWDHEDMVCLGLCSDTTLPYR